MFSSQKGQSYGCFIRICFSDAELVEHLYELAVEWLVAAYGLAERHIYNLVVAHTYHYIALSLLYGLDGSYASA